MSSLPEKLLSSLETTLMPAQPAHVSRPLTIVIDGPSGSGKTTMAADITQHLLEHSRAIDAHREARDDAARSGTSVSTLHMDDLYDGWSGLQRGIETVTRLIDHRRTGVELSWQSYNWHSASFEQWRSVPAEHVLIIEGCGSLVVESIDVADIRIWLDAPEQVRMQRAFSRGGENYEEFWQVWQTQFAKYVREQNPQSRANLLLDSTL